MKKKVKKKIQGWSLWKDGVSQSFIASYLTCREQTRLKYIELWQSKTISLPLEFGNCFHWMLKNIYTPKKVSMNPAAIKALMAKYKNFWKKHNPIPSKKQLEKQEIVYGMCTQVLPEYVKRWDGDWKNKYTYGANTVKPKKWLALENRYEIPYTYPDGKKTFLLAVFDGCFYDKRKRLWLFETKTKSRIDEETLQDMILQDVQIMLSLWIIKNVLDRIPSGVLYNVIRRPGQKLLKDENLKSFLGRIKKDVSNPKRYDHYFKRWEFAINWNEVKQWKKDFLDPVMMEIRMWYEGKLTTYINPYSLVNQYGRSDMYNIIVRGDKTNYSQRKQYRKGK